MGDDLDGLFGHDSRGIISKPYLMFIFSDIPLHKLKYVIMKMICMGCNIGHCVCKSSEIGDV